MRLHGRRVLERCDLTLQITDALIALRQVTRHPIEDYVDFVHSVAAQPHGKGDSVNVVGREFIVGNLKWSPVARGGGKLAEPAHRQQRNGNHHRDTDNDEHGSHEPILAPRPPVREDGRVTTTDVPVPQGDLRLGSQVFGPDQPLVMAIVNRTPDSFYNGGATMADADALAAVDAAVERGADIVDIGGVKAGPGDVVDPAEELRRVTSFVAQVRARYSSLIISVDTWRAEVGEAVCQEGADLLNDAWGGHDQRLAEVAARHGVGLVCTHTGGATPRTRPHRVAYDDVMADILRQCLSEAERAKSLGVPADRIVIDPGHDFGKNTRHSLEATRRLDEMVATGWPVLVSLSRKDFVGEAIGVPVPAERLIGTLATTAVSMWLGARIYRVHDVAETRAVLDMVGAIQGTRAPSTARRGLA